MGRAQESTLDTVKPWEVEESAELAEYGVCANWQYRGMRYVSNCGLQRRRVHRVLSHPSEEDESCMAFSFDVGEYNGCGQYSEVCA
jgi:hypothetical protein